MKTKFRIKQKGKHKLKAYPKTRLTIINLAQKTFGCDIEDHNQIKLKNVNLFYRDQNVQIDEIIQDKFLSRIKKGTYLFKSIEINNQSLSLMIHFKEPLYVQDQKRYKRYLYPEDFTLIYVYVKNLKN